MCNTFIRILLLSLSLTHISNPNFVYTRTSSPFSKSLFVAFLSPASRVQNTNLSCLTYFTCLVRCQSQAHEIPKSLTNRQRDRHTNLLNL